jgi:hypothetical protein
MLARGSEEASSSPPQGEAAGGGTARLLFIGGIPHAGTTLLEQFVRHHKGTIPLAGKNSRNNEWFEDGAANGGHSQDELYSVCRLYPRLVAKGGDPSRANISVYLERAMHVGGSELGARARGKNVLAFVKDPPLLLRVAELHASAIANGVHAQFLLTTVRPTQWRGRPYDHCEGTRRDQVMANWALCYSRVLAQLAKLPAWAWRLVRIEDFGRIELWRDLEAWCVHGSSGVDRERERD